MCRWSLAASIRRTANISKKYEDILIYSDDELVDDVKTRHVLPCVVVFSTLRHAQLPDKLVPEYDYYGCELSQWGGWP